jgi:hypothetical protein
MHVDSECKSIPCLTFEHRNDKNKEVFDNFIELHHMLPISPSLGTDAYEMLLKLLGKTFDKRHVPSIVFEDRLNLYSDQKDNSPTTGCSLINIDGTSITLKFDTNFEINSLIECLKIQYEYAKRLSSETSRFIECCQKPKDQLSHHDHIFMEGILKFVGQDYTDCDDNIFLQGFLETESNHYNRRVKIFIESNGSIVPKDDLPRLVGLWVWENLAIHGGRHDTVVSAIKEFETMPFVDKFELGYDPSYYLWLERTEACIDSAKVLPFSKRKSVIKKSRTLLEPENNNWFQEPKTIFWFFFILGLFWFLLVIPPTARMSRREGAHSQPEYASCKPSITKSPRVFSVSPRS